MKSTTSFIKGSSQWIISFWTSLELNAYKWYWIFTIVTIFTSVTLQIHICHYLCECIPDHKIGHFNSKLRNERKFSWLFPLIIHFGKRTHKAVVNLSSLFHCTNFILWHSLKWKFFVFHFYQCTSWDETTSVNVKGILDLNWNGRIHFENAMRKYFMHIMWFVNWTNLIHKRVYDIMEIMMKGTKSN